jgi:hypothetical protein
MAASSEIQDAQPSEPSPLGLAHAPFTFIKKASPKAFQGLRLQA